MNKGRTCGLSDRTGVVKDRTQEVTRHKRRGMYGVQLQRNLNKHDQGLITVAEELTDILELSFFIPNCLSRFAG